MITFGRKSGTIQKTEHSQPCWSCRDFDMCAEVHIDYFHIYYIPVFPFPKKSVTVTCNKCGNYQTDKFLEEKHQKETHAPLHYYSGLLIAPLIVVAMFFLSSNAQKERQDFIANPQPGDVYQVHQKTDSRSVYYFMKAKNVTADSVFLYMSHLRYTKHKSRLAREDYFEKNRLVPMAKTDLKTMLDKEEITTIKRKYPDSSPYNREQ